MTEEINLFGDKPRVTISVETVPDSLLETITVYGIFLKQYSRVLATVIDAKGRFQSVLLLGPKDHLFDIDDITEGRVNLDDLPSIPKLELIEVSSYDFIEFISLYQDQSIHFKIGQEVKLTSEMSGNRMRSRAVFPKEVPILSPQELPVFIEQAVELFKNV